MKYLLCVALCAASVALATGQSLAQSSPQNSQPVTSPTPPTVGAHKTLTDASGMTLYTFDRDMLGQSNCKGACLKRWPPLLAPKTAEPTGDFTIITRPSGQHQWAYDGMPLYLYSGDENPGQDNGMHVPNWMVARATSP